ncbi:MAG: hydrogenase maturation nickel metallochaperone HypA [Planctomycetota bacterium]
MHEFAIAQSLIAAATAEGERARATRITKLVCRIGSLRQVDDWLIREAFEIARADTLCAESELVVEKVAMQAFCTDCRDHFAVQDWDWRCPACGKEGEAPSGGDELELVSIDAEVPDGDNGPEERL